LQFDIKTVRPNQRLLAFISGFDVSQKLGQDKPLPFQLPDRSKVDQVTHRLATDSHVVQELSLMVRRQTANGFQFDNHLVEYNEVGDIPFALD
jgi:hypothetical protein